MHQDFRANFFLPLLLFLLCITFAFRVHRRSTHGEISVGWWLDVGSDGLGVGRQLSAGRGAGRTTSVVAAAAATQKVQQLCHRGQAQQQQHQEVQCRNWRLTSRCGISCCAILYSTEPYGVYYYIFIDFKIPHLFEITFNSNNFWKI